VVALEQQMKKPTKFGAWPRKRFRNRMGALLGRIGNEVDALVDEMRRAGATRRDVMHVMLDAMLDASGAGVGH
jgi:hypothetical protein